MIPHPGIVRHDPPNSYGDCLRAAVASIFNIEQVTDVPHFFRDGDQVRGDAELRDWLLFRGYRPFMVSMDGNAATIDEIFEMMGITNAGTQYLLFCDCGDGDHVVVCQGRRVIHNPAMVRSSPRGPSSNGYWGIMVFVPVKL